jgi:hypothetical protein
MRECFKRDGILTEVVMTIHIKGGFANNLMVQMIALAIVVAIVSVIAWRYVW